MNQQTTKNPPTRTKRPYTAPAVKQRKPLNHTCSSSSVPLKYSATGTK
jgi:hypothetical protein